MKKFAVAALAAALCAGPGLALAAAPGEHAVEKHKAVHPKPVHATNPYLKHPLHKAKRGHHKKI